MTGRSRACCGPRTARAPSFPPRLTGYFEAPTSVAFSNLMLDYEAVHPTSHDPVEIFRRRGDQGIRTRLRLVSRAQAESTSQVSGVQRISRGEVALTISGQVGTKSPFAKVVLIEGRPHGQSS
jgi:hypothetical protein